MFKISVRFNELKDDIEYTAQCFNVSNRYLNIVTSDGRSISYSRDEVYAIFLIPDIKN